MSSKDREKWNKKYASSEHKADRTPSKWLKENAGLLTGKGKALDIAMGEGRNAIFLAGLGYDVLGIDISEAAVRNAMAFAKKKKLKIEAIAADLDSYQFGESQFNLVLCFNFLDRRLFSEIRNTLLPGGLLFYETFNIDHLKHNNFKKEWVLDHNELLREFESFRIIKYQEVERNHSALTYLIAEKPAP